MRFIRPMVPLLFLMLALSCSGSPETPQGVSRLVGTDMPVIPEVPAKPIQWRDPDLAARVRGLRTVNLGNALEAPAEGAWGMVLEESYFTEISRAGFNGVRIPVKWSAHAAAKAPYGIDPVFFERIDWVLSQCEKNNLLAILNMHHYDEIYTDPRGHEERFKALWSQIASRYRDRPEDALWFELLNEPRGTLVFPLWNTLADETLSLIRRTNRERPVMFCGTDWSGYQSLFTIKIPDDPHLIVTFHYYLPHTFTHQGAEWNPGSESWMGNEWLGNEKLVKEMSGHFSLVAKWMAREGVPIYLGEFGAYYKCPRESRLRWTYAVARLAEAYGFGWGYWEFGAGFGIYDREASAWRQDLATVLYPSGDYGE